MPETTVYRLDVMSGGKGKWQAPTSMDWIIDPRRRIAVTDLRCALDRITGERDRVGSAWIARDIDGRLVIRATPDRPTMRYAFRAVDMDTDRAWLEGDIELFDEPYHDRIDIAEARRFLLTRLFGG